MKVLTVQVVVPCLLLALTSVISSPVLEELDIIIISENGLPSINATTNSTIPSAQSQDKLRQDGDGDGDGAEAAGAAAAALGEGEIGTNVANILQGVLGGGFEGIFKGATSFIGEEDTQQGVSTILQSLTKPLNTVFASGFQAGQKYFGFGPTTPASLNATQTQTVAGATTGTGAVVVEAGEPAAPVSAPVAPAAPAATVTENPDDDDDTEADLKLRKQ